MFPVTFTVHNVAQLNAVMAALALNAAPAEPTTSELVQAAQQRAAATTKPAKAVEQIHTPQPTVETAKETAAAQVEKQKPAAAKKEEPAASPSTAAANDAPATKDAATSDAKAPTYDQASAAIVKLAKKSRALAVEVLAKFGAKKLPDVAPEKFAEVIAAANEALKEAA